MPHQRKRIKEKFARDYWNRASKNYKHERWLKNDVVNFDYNWTKKNLLEILEPKKNESVLELGCGPGTWTEIVEKKVKELVAVDISSEMVNLARRNAKNTKFHVSDVLKFKTNKKFDKIFSVRAIEYIYNKKKFLKKVHSVLKPGGKLVIITKSKPNLWDITSKSEWQKRINARKLKKLMEDEGFKNVNYAPVSIRFPIFKRGVYEAPIIPEHKEKKALSIFNKLTNICRKLKILPSFFSIFSESYIICAYK